MLQVCKKRCSECLFSDNKIVSEDRKLDLLRQCRRTDAHFICHRSTIHGGAAVCRGFYDIATSQLIRIAQRLDCVEFVDVPENL